MKQSWIILLFLLNYVGVQAQIVNIPDVSFKHILTTDNCVDLDDDGIGDADADTNNDGEIQVSEALAVEYLIVDSATPSMRIILDLTGLEAFINLKSFYSADVNFSEQQNIGGSLQYIGVDPIDFTSNLNLERIDISDEVLISGVDVSGLTSLTNLRLFWVRPVYEFEGPNLPAFIDIQGCSNLINLDLMDTYNTEIDFCEAPSLETINCFSFTSPNSLDLNFNCLPNLRILDISETFLNSLFLKNGSVLESLNSFSVVGNILCVDNNQDELDSLGNLLDYFQYVTTTCDVPLGNNTVSGDIQVNITPNVGNCGTNNLRSIIKFDFLQNNDVVFNVQSSNTNNYEIPIGQGDYQVMPTTNFSDGYNVVPNQFDVSFTGNNGELFEQDICLEPRVESIDGIDIRFYPFSYPTEPSIRRFDAYIDLENTNATNYTGQLRLVYDDNLSFLMDYDVDPDINSNGETIWNTINISSNSSVRIFLRIAYNSDTHPNYPLFAGDDLVYDLYLTNSQGSGRVFNEDSDFRLIQTIDAGEQTLSIIDGENSITSAPLSIYPNPVETVINIHNRVNVKDVSIFSINGQLILSRDYSSDVSDWIQFDVSELDNGMYFLSIRTETSTITKKIIKK